jgi:hypothetical protein
MRPVYAKGNFLHEGRRWSLFAISARSEMIGKLCAVAMSVTTQPRSRASSISCVPSGEQRVEQILARLTGRARMSW